MSFAQGNSNLKYFGDVANRSNSGPPRPGPPEWVFRETAYCTFCNKEIMKIGTRARCAENPRAEAARALLIYFTVTKSTVQL